MDQQMDVRECVINIKNIFKNILFISQENRGLMGMVNFGIAVFEKYWCKFWIGLVLIKKI